ncbi:MAG TPA: HD domain-containing protein [Patescibacteria group bacterium]|nr:HD domain-containing protein [Patescibacteria group bacterium]
MTINKFLDFLKFSQKFTSTKRAIFALGEDRKENDVEHSYQLAIVTWYVIENEKLKLDTNLAIKYALVHDLEEALFGDIHIFDEKGRKEKEKKEKAARNKIIKMFPKWSEYKTLSKNYKLLADEESKLVNGIDKILPVLNIYLDKGRTWKKEKRSLDDIAENKRVTTKVHPFTQKLWKEVENMLIKEKLRLF